MRYTRKGFRFFCLHFRHYKDWGWDDVRGWHTGRWVKDLEFLRILQRPTGLDLGRQAVIQTWNCSPELDSIPGGSRLFAAGRRHMMMLVAAFL
jgi:hypothetical protein